MKLAKPENCEKTMSQIARTDQIESRIDRSVAGSIGITAGTGLAIESVSQAMEIAKLMAVSGSAVPNHLRNNPGACLAVAIQGWEWGVNPFAIANKSYVVNDRLSYESAIYHAVMLKRAPIKGRLKTEYRGEGQQRKCIISATLLNGDHVQYESPETGKITPKNSPLWRNDPDQQLFYFSVRSFGRRHFPDVMLGIYTDDEMLDATPIDPSASGAQKAISRIEPAPDRVDILDGPEAAPEPRAHVPILDDAISSREETLPAVVESGPLEEPSEPPADEAETIKLREWLSGPWKQLEREMRSQFVRDGKGTPHDFTKLAKTIVGIVPEKSTFEERLTLWNEIQAIVVQPA